MQLKDGIRPFFFSGFFWGLLFKAIRAILLIVVFSQAMYSVFVDTLYSPL